MNFKDALDADILDIFLDESEFAKKVNINGQDVLGIMEDATEAIKTGASSGFANASGLGLFSHDVTLYIKANELEDNLIPGDKIYIDDFAYTIADAPNAVLIQESLLIIMLVKHYS